MWTFWSSQTWRMQVSVFHIILFFFFVRGFFYFDVCFIFVFVLCVFFSSAFSSIHSYRPVCSLISIRVHCEVFSDKWNVFKHNNNKLSISVYLYCSTSCFVENVENLRTINTERMNIQNNWSSRMERVIKTTTTPATKECHQTQIRIFYILVFIKRSISIRFGL